LPTARNAFLRLVVAFLLHLGVTASPAFAEEKSPANAGKSPQPNPERGRQIYMAVGCYACHGTVGQGAPGTGPKLAPGTLPFAAILATIRKPRGVMPPYTRRVLSDQSVADIHAYLDSIKPSESL